MGNRKIGTCKELDTGEEVVQESDPDWTYREEEGEGDREREGEGEGEGEREGE